MNRRASVGVLSALVGVLLVACAPTPETRTAAPQSATPAQGTEMKPTTSGYAEVNGIKLYHEIYGSGEPSSDPRRADDHCRDAGMGANAGEDAAGDCCGNARSRSHVGHRSSDELGPNG